MRSRAHAVVFMLVMAMALTSSPVMAEEAHGEHAEHAGEVVPHGESGHNYKNGLALFLGATNEAGHGTEPTWGLEYGRALSPHWAIGGLIDYAGGSQRNMVIAPDSLLEALWYWVRLTCCARHRVPQRARNGRAPPLQGRNRSCRQRRDLFCPTARDRILFSFRIPIRNRTNSQCRFCRWPRGLGLWCQLRGDVLNSLKTLSATLLSVVRPGAVGMGLGSVYAFGCGRSPRSHPGGTKPDGDTGTRVEPGSRARVHGRIRIDS